MPEIAGGSKGEDGSAGDLTPVERRRGRDVVDRDSLRDHLVEFEPTPPPQR